MFFFQILLFFVINFTCRLVCSFAFPIACKFIHDYSFIHSFIHSFIYPFIHLFIRSCIQSFIHISFIYLFICTFYVVLSFTCSFFHFSVNPLFSFFTSFPIFVCLFVLFSSYLPPINLSPFSSHFSLIRSLIYRYIFVRTVVGILLMSLFCSFPVVPLFLFFSLRPFVYLSPPTFLPSIFLLF